MKRIISIFNLHEGEDDREKTLESVKNNITYNLPTCKLGISDDNSFANLPTNDHENTPGIELL